MPEWLMVVLAFVAAIALLVHVGAQSVYVKELTERLDEVERTTKTVHATLERNRDGLRQVQQAVQPEQGFVDRLSKVEASASRLRSDLTEGLARRASSHTELQSLNTELTFIVYQIGVDLDEVRARVFPGSKPRTRLKRWAEKQGESESSGDPSYKPGNLLR